MSMVTHKSNKAAAVDFLQMVVADRIEEAYQQYVDMGGKHHNAYFPAGFPSLEKAMKENQIQFPLKVFTVKHALEDNDLVAVHSHTVLRSGEMEFAVVHLFRFHEGKIVEMWDMGQQVPVDSANKDGMF